MNLRTWQPNLTFGAGYDKVRGDAKQVGVTGTPAPPTGAAGQTGDSSLLIVQSSDEFDEAIGIDAEVKVGVGLFGGNAKFDFKKRSKVSSQATFCVLRVFATNAYEQLLNPVFAPDARELLQNNNSKRFRERFGDLFVSGQFSGVEFYGSVRIEAKKVERQLEIAAGIQASYGLTASGRADTNISEKMSSAEQRIEITTYQKGGSVNVCADLTQLFKLAQDALNEGRAGRGYPFAAQLNAYNELKLPNDDASFIDAEFAQRTLQRLAGHMQAMEKMANDIDFVLRNQEWFEGFDVTTLNAANKAIAAELNRIKEQADICSRDFARCQEYAPEYPQFVLPPRKVGAPAPPAPPPPIATRPGGRFDRMRLADVMVRQMPDLALVRR